MTTPKKAQPWDQMPAEDNAAYARFLVYRNLGLKRSLKRAYAKTLRDANLFNGDHRKLNLPASWRMDSNAYRWVARSSAWDLRNLALYGSRVAVLHVRAVEIVAKKAAAAAKRLNVGDDGWRDVLESLRFVGQFLTPEIVRDIEAGLRERLASAGHPSCQTTEAKPTSPASDPDE
jgi:hypothetical protein